MAKVTTKIQFSEKELLALICEKYNLNSDGASINVSKIEGDRPFDSSYTTITVEAEPKVPYTER